MREIGLEERKKLQLDILIDVASFCEKHGIIYFLSSGTLLGAVRHQGYIPWDDDIDIMMPRPDYTRFAQEYNSDIYEFMDMNKDVSFPYVLAKVVDKRTYLKERVINCKQLGVHIDIFPLDGLSRNELIQRIHLFIMGRLIYSRVIKFIDLRGVESKLKVVCYICFKLLLLLFSQKCITKLVVSCQQSYAWSSSECISSLGSSNERLVGRKEWFDYPLLKIFENEQFQVPNGYDNWLKLIYGDYMELPPVEKRIAHHTFKAWWKD